MSTILDSLRRKTLNLAFSPVIFIFQTEKLRGICAEKAEFP